MSKEFMKVYHMPFKAQEIKDDNFTNFRLQFDQAFEEMTKSFAEQQDEIIVNYLYEKYKDTKVSDVWVLSKPDFEKFLFEMLPKWKGKNTDIIDNYMGEPSEALKCLEKLTLLTCNIEWYKDNINTIKQALLKAQKEHKALEIIKRFIWVEDDKLKCGRYADIEIELEEEDFESKEEFELLRSVLE